MGYRIFEHELTTIDSIHFKRGILHLVQNTALGGAFGAVFAMAGFYFLDRHFDRAFLVMAVAGGGLALWAWWWKRRLRFRMNRIRLRGEDVGP